MFRLALAFGCSITELLDRVPSHEFTEWIAYWQIEPWGAWRDNWHHASTASLLYNINRGSRHKPVSPGDFMFTSAEDRVEQRKSKLAENALAFIRANNAKRKRSG